MTKDPNFKEQLVEAYREIQEIKQKEEASKTRAYMMFLFIAGLPLVIQILIKPTFIGMINAVKCGQPTQQCLEVLLHRED